MKVQVLRSAMEGLAAGRKFYDRQEAGVGDYFFDSLFAENRFTGDFEKYAMQDLPLFVFLIGGPRSENVDTQTQRQDDYCRVYGCCESLLHYS